MNKKKDKPMPIKQGRHKKVVESFVKEFPKKVEEVVLKEETPSSPRCECGQYALPNNYQCWACSHRS